KLGQVALGATVVVVTAALLVRTALRSAEGGTAAAPSPIPTTTAAGSVAAPPPVPITTKSHAPLPRPRPRTTSDADMRVDADGGPHGRSEIDGGASTPPSADPMSKLDAGF